MLILTILFSLSSFGGSGFGGAGNTGHPANGAIPSADATISGTQPGEAFSQAGPAPPPMSSLNNTNNNNAVQLPGD